MSSRSRRDARPDEGRSPKKGGRRTFGVGSAHLCPVATRALSVPVCLDLSVAFDIVADRSPPRRSSILGLRDTAVAFAFLIPL